MSDNGKGAAKALLNPVFIIAFSILISVILFIGAAILGIDKGVLNRMSEFDFARGLITYLFAVITIGTAVVLVVSALTSGATEEDDKRFQRGREVLALLLGIFGTIVGFYFGTELSTRNPSEVTSFQLSTPLVRSANLGNEEVTVVVASVTGGNPPYRFQVTVGNNPLAEYWQPVRPDGWILTETSMHPVGFAENNFVRVWVVDAADQRLTKNAEPFAGSSKLGR